MRLPLLVALCLGLAVPATAQQSDPVPTKRLVVTRNVDFPGGDIRSYFNTTYEACVEACFLENACAALTFNGRSNACFLKSRADAETPFQGATSAKVRVTDPAVVVGGRVRADEIRAFVGDYSIDQARLFALAISNQFYPGSWDIDRITAAAAEARRTNNLADAVLYTGSALTLSDAPEHWVEYGRLMLDRANQGGSNQWNDRTAGLNAAIAGYLRATTPAARVSALAMMARALEANQRGRDMIPALRLAQDIQPRDENAAALDSAVGKYGFRIVETQVDSDAASPRVCATFSEQVLAGGSDYASFVTIDQGDPVVTSEGYQVCVEGLEHGKRYRVAFRPGLRAASGETLIRPSELTFYVRDRTPSVRFPGRGYILPASGQVALPIVGVNVTEVDLKLRRVSDRNLIRTIQNDYFGRPLDYWAEETFANQMAEDIWSGKGTLNTELNRDVTTRLPLGEMLQGLDPGVYVLQASVPGQDRYDYPAAGQWFVVSDIGLASMSGNDGMHVFARSLGSAEAKGGVAVTLLSRSNSVLGRAVTDDRGYVRFDAGLTRGQGGTAPAMLTAEVAGDLSFLPLTDPEFDLSDRGVEGNEPAKPIDVFVATERGVYRAGETVHATVLVRDAKAEAIAGLPMTAVLLRPDGVEYSRHQVTGEVAGGYAIHLPIAGSAPRGTWRLDLHSDPNAPALATRRFLVEDFLPERIDFSLSLPEGLIRADETPPLTIEARYLFGAPGADLRIEGEVLLRPLRSLEAWPGFVFGRHDIPVSGRYMGLPYDMRTDEQGLAEIAVEFPEIEEVTSPLEALVTVRVSEGSGRPVERRLSRAVASPGPVIGIRPLFGDEVVPENGTAAFQLIALDDAQQPMPMRVKWVMNRVETRYQWYQMYGDWNWEPVTRRTRVAEGELALSGEAVRIEAPVRWGAYELRVERSDGAYVSASTGFYAGWYVSADTTDTPDTLELSLDRAAYSPGDTAVVRLVPRYAGKALVTVLSDRLITMVAADVTEGENLIRLPVTDDWGAGAYVTVSVIRPMDIPAGQMPARSLGLSYAAVAPGEHQLAVEVEVAPEVDPRGPMPVAVRVGGVKPGETAYVTLAAVDEGILNLTGFKTPDPSAHYFGQRKLGVGLRDVYGRLIDATQGSLGAVRSGGDAAAELGLQNVPPVEELVAYFSGPLIVGPDGYARHSFDLPSFNGSVKVMAIAWSPTGVGQDDAQVLVRDPVVVTASVPRFLSPGDGSRLLLEFAHATGPAGQMRLSVTAEGLALDARLVPASVQLGEGGRATLSLPFRAGDAGLTRIEVALTTPDGKVLTKTLRLPVQANDPEISRTSRFALAAGQTFTFDDQVFAGLIPGSGTATLAVGPLAYLDAPGLLEALDRYPYGCTEQITSRALPLLYLDEVAVAMGLAERDRQSERINQAIAEVLTNQASNGAFGLWYPSGGDLWLDAYVTDFLSRARARGFVVPANAFRMAVDNLRNQVAYAADFDSGGEAIAYALLVLAREGAAAIGDLRYYADQKPDAFSTPLAQAQLGAALASYGDQARADAMFNRAMRRMTGLPSDERVSVWRSDYGTNLRDAAAVLTLAVEAGTNVIDRDALAARVAAPQQTRRLSTQESVWTLLAAHALLGDQRMQGFTVNGEPVTGPLVRVLEHDTLGRSLAITNGSGREAMVTMTAYGVPATPEPAGGDGYRIERTYFTLDGEQVDPARVAAGTRLVTLLTVEPVGSREARLIVNDPLPAGFEIDNPNLLRGGDIGALDWLDLNVEPNATEFRQERFIAAVDWRSNDSFRLAYIVRAISPGTFRHPAASVEDMYRPQFRARTATGSVTVTE